MSIDFISISTLMLLSLQVKVLRAENIPINYKTQTAKTSVKVAILPSRFSKVGSRNKNNHILEIVPIKMSKFSA